METMLDRALTCFHFPTMFSMAIVFLILVKGEVGNVSEENSLPCPYQFCRGFIGFYAKSRNLNSFCDVYWFSFIIMHFQLNLIEYFSSREARPYQPLHELGSLGDDKFKPFPKSSRGFYVSALQVCLKTL